MGWKLLFLACLGAATMWFFGFGPEKMHRLASSAADGTADAIMGSVNDS